MLDGLDTRLAHACADDLGHLDFLQMLCDYEISRRYTAGLARRLHRAHWRTSPSRRVTLWQRLWTMRVLPAPTAVEDHGFADAEPAECRQVA